MEHLYAPWRSAYVSRERPALSRDKAKKSCFLCENQKSKKDKENFVLSRQAKSFTLLNIYPYNDGHLLIAPYRHAAHPNLLSKEEWRDLNESCRQALQALDNILRPEGYNIGMNLGKVSGAGFDQHLHLHVVPRWLGDTNFMPLLGNTKMINQDLVKLYRKLKPAFAVMSS